MVSVNAARLLGEISQRQAAFRCFSRPEKVQDKILFVEGRIDNNIFSTLVDDRTRVISAGLVQQLYKHSKGPKFLVKPAIIEAVNIANIDAKYQKFKVFGLVDKDYEDACLETSHLFVTDENDLETLIYKTGSFSFLKEFEGATEKHISTIDCLTYQLGCYRKSFFKYIDDSGKDVNIREYLDEDLIKEGCFQLFKMETDLSLKSLIDVVKKNPDNRFHGGLENEIVTNFINRDLRAKDIYTEKNKFKHSVSSFDREVAPDFWNTLKGHDIKTVAKAIIPSAKDYYDNKMDDFIAAKLNREIFKKTSLFQRMASAGFMAA